MERGAIISPCGKYRYSLWRIWDSHKTPVMWIMLNPSTADSEDDDPTMRRVIQFSKDFGYGGCYVGNLLPLITPDQTELKRWYVFHEFHEVKKIFEKASNELNGMYNKTGDVIFAWGNGGDICKPRIKAIRNWAQRVEARTLCLGITANQHPTHPLFLKSDTKLLTF